MITLKQVYNQWVKPTAKAVNVDDNFNKIFAATVDEFNLLVDELKNLLDEVCGKGEEAKGHLKK